MEARIYLIDRGLASTIKSKQTNETNESTNELSGASFSGLDPPIPLYTGSPIWASSSNPTLARMIFCNRDRLIGGARQAAPPTEGVMASGEQSFNCQGVRNGHCEAKLGA